MNLYALLGILAIIYAIVVIGMAIKQPEIALKIKKTNILEKVLGVKGAVLFRYIWGALFMFIGIWLLGM